LNKQLTAALHFTPTASFPLTGKEMAAGAGGEIEARV